MNRKNWDDDNLIDGEIIHCSVCGEDQAHFDDKVFNSGSSPKETHLEHECYYCGWDIHQTEKSVEMSYDKVEYAHEVCVDERHRWNKRHRLQVEQRRNKNYAKIK